MTDETVAETTTRPNAPTDEESTFGDAADDAPATDAGEQNPNVEAQQDEQGSEDAEDKPAAEVETGATEEMKVVVTIKRSRATIGVQQPSSDPHIETFDDHDLPTLAQEVAAVTERAMARWEETPKHPAYARPTPPARSRNRRRQGAAQASTVEGAAEPEQAQTPRLF